MVATSNNAGDAHGEGGVTMDEEWVLFLYGRDCYHRRVAAYLKGGQEVWIAACVSTVYGWWNYTTVRKSEAVSRFGMRPCKRCYPEVKQ